MLMSRTYINGAAIVYVADKTNTLLEREDVTKIRAMRSIDPRLECERVSSIHVDKAIDQSSVNVLSCEWEYFILD
jgi:hypothetical protein